MTPELMKKKPIMIRECLFTGSQQQGGIVVNLNTGLYYPMNKTAHDIWHAIDGKRTLGAIAAKIAKKYKVKKATVAKDVYNYVLFLGRARLIRWRR